MVDIKNGIDNILTPMIEGGINQEEAVMLLVLGLCFWVEAHPQINILEKLQVNKAFFQDRIAQYHAN